MARMVKVFAPATVANVAAGFDILGFAVHDPGDEVVAELSADPGVRIRSIDGDGGRLPRDPTLNTATVPILGLLAHLGSKAGMEVDIRKKMPLGSGLGSSAASAVAGVFAANELLGRPLCRKDLLPFALEGERAACGSAHADNAGPALLGGFVLVRSYDPLDVVKIPSPDELVCSLLHPALEVRTEDARRILRSRIRLSDAVVQWGNTAGLVAGLVMGDYDLIGRSIRDVIVEPVRSILVPGFDMAKAAALEAGALGCSISGSGPSIFALSRGEDVAQKVAGAMASVYRGLGIPVDLHISRVNTEGPVVLEASD